MIKNTLLSGLLAMHAVQAATLTTEQLEKAAVAASIAQGVVNAVTVVGGSIGQLLWGKQQPGTVQEPSAVRDFLNDYPYMPTFVNENIIHSHLGEYAAALEKDKSLLGALGDHLARMALVNNESLLGIVALVEFVAWKGHSELPIQDRQNAELIVVRGIVRLLSGVGQALVFNKINQFVKEKYPTKDEMAKRRVVRTLSVFAITLVAHAFLMCCSTLLQKYATKGNVSIELKDIIAFPQLMQYVLLPFMGAMLTEFIGHNLAQKIVDATVSDDKIDLDMVLPVMEKPVSA